MNIFQKDDAYLFAGDIGEKLRGVMEGKIMDLPGISKNASQVRTGGKIQPDQMADEMGVKSSGFLISYVTENPTLQFLTRNGGAIIILNSKTGRKNVTKKRIRDLCYFLRGPALKKVHGLILYIQPPCELIEQARFARPCFGYNIDQMQLFLLYHLPKGRLHLRQFFFTTNGMGLNSLYTSRWDSKCARFYTIDGVDLDRFTFPFDCDRIKDGYFENPTHMLVCIVRNQDSTSGRGLL